MTSSTALDTPLLADSTLLILVPLSDRADALTELGIDAKRLEPVGEDTFSLRLDLPAGEWLAWPSLGQAMWIGDNPLAIPPALSSREETSESEPLSALLDRLALAGVWCRDAALYLDDGWSRSLRAEAVAATLRLKPARGISGVFVDREGHTARLELGANGFCWTDRPAQAIEWLLNIGELPAPL